MQYKIRLYGMFAEKAGNKLIYLDADSEISVSVLKDFVIKTFPSLTGNPYKIAVNQEFVSDDIKTLKETDEIALLPPFAGG